MLGSIWQLFVLFCLAGSISCVSWSTLTATQLSALEPELFSDITIEQLASIPTQVIAVITCQIQIRSGSKSHKNTPLLI
jgi:hypothetical protein